MNFYLILFIGQTVNRFSARVQVYSRDNI